MGLGEGRGNFLQKVPPPFPNFLAPSRSAGCLRGGLVAADLVLFDGRRGGLVGIAVFGKRGGYGDAAGAGFESSLDEPADFMAAEPGGVRSEDDRDEARVAAPHGGNDIVAGSRDPAGFQAVGTGAGPEQRVFVRCDHPPVLEHADAVVLERRGIVLEVHVSKPRHISGCGVLPGGGQAVGRFERAGRHADLAGLVVLNFSLGSVVYYEVRFEISQFFIGRNDEHILYEMSLPSNLHNKTDRHTGVFICATESIYYKQSFVGELI